MICPLFFPFKKNWMHPPSSHGSHNAQVMSFLFLLLSVCTDIESLLKYQLVARSNCIASRMLVPCCMSWSSEKDIETMDKPCLYCRVHTAVCLVNTQLPYPYTVCRVRMPTRMHVNAALTFKSLITIIVVFNLLY